MPTPAVHRTTARVGTAKRLLARIENLYGVNATSVSLASISVSTISLVNATATGPTAKVVATTIYDTLQSWPVGEGEEAAPDATGWNSQIVIGASILATVGDTVRVVVTYVPAVGQTDVDPIKDVWDIEVLRAI